MGWFVRERRGVSWKDQTLDSVAAPPLPLVVFLGLFVMLLYFATYSEYKEKIERSKMGFKLGLFLLPVVGITVVYLIMLHRRWWRYTFGGSTPMYQAVAVEGSSPWGLLLVVGLLLVMVHYQSSFRSLFRSF